MFISWCRADTPFDFAQGRLVRRLCCGFFELNEGTALHGRGRTKPTSKARTRVSAPHRLLNRMLRRIALTCHNLIFHIFALLIFDLEGAAIGSNHFDF